MNKLMQAVMSLESLTNYRSLINDKVISGLYELLKAIHHKETDPVRMTACYSDFVHRLMVSGAESVPCLSLSHYLRRRILYEETPFSRAAEKTDYALISEGLVRAAAHDLRALEKVASLSPKEIKEAMIKSIPDGDSAQMIRELPEWRESSEKFTTRNEMPWDEMTRDDMYRDEIPLNEMTRDGMSIDEAVKSLADFHRRNGSGIFALFKGFIWTRQDQRGYLEGIPAPDPVSLDGFIGYERQRQQIIENTLQFLNGYAVNNVLLYGDRGTGKSSTVKALLNAYHAIGLRMIEIPRMYLSDFPEVVRIVKGRPQRFIIFIDDLAFDDDEESYTALKAVLEGGLEGKPDNMVIYATSNRRHLVRERFIDRKGLLSDNPYEEVHATDTLQEKLSLADRFGITITFESPVQEEYLRIVEGLVQKEGLEISTEEVRREAVRWEMHYNGRSPRTAQQFVSYLKAKSGLAGQD
jgi:predicted AAA+ superfamily ATPase